MGSRLQTNKQRLSYTQGLIFLVLPLVWSCQTLRPSTSTAPADPMLHALLLNPKDANLPEVAPLLADAALFEPPILHGDSSRLIASAKLPLAGLRFALDPGHMGGKLWDERTGKYVIDGKGERLSEGVMALELALLLESRLKSLGADVMLTRRTLAPVTTKPYPVGAGAKAEGDFNHDDLEARAQLILADKPDVVLILHFDESTPGSDHNIDHLANRCNDTKAYVPGGFAAMELQDPEDRELFRTIASHRQVWETSAELSRTITDEISRATGVPRTETSSPNLAGKSVPLSPGVFARNLYLSRHLAGIVSSYVETLCYEDPAQLKALLREDRSMKIDGREYKYSSRLEEIAEAITRGVVRAMSSR